MNIYQEVASLIAEGGSGVLVTLAAADGATPRKPGTKMLVRADGSISGTIGGGSFEQEVQRLALEVLTANETRLVSFDESGPSGLTCGGKSSVLFEPLTAGPGLFIVGNGHVGMALAKIAESCSWQVRIFDDRPASDKTSGQLFRIDGYEDPFANFQLGAKSGIVIASRSHAFDLQSLRAALATNAGFIGLLGSRKKKSAFFSTLRNEGVTEEQLARVETPVGISIGANSPAEIAVSIMAQLIGWQRGV